jgi:hypothetical protein
MDVSGAFCRKAVDGGRDMREEKGFRVKGEGEG